VLLYYAISIGWAWLAWSPVVLGSRGLKLLSIDPSLAVFSCIATLGPFFGCFITHHSESGNWKAVRLLPRLPGQWIWLLFGPLLILIPYFLVFPALISKGNPAQWQWHPAVLTGLLVPMFNYNLLGGPLFEEFGWRGFLQPRLQRVMPPWVAAVLVGLMWAAWHAPLFLTTWSSASPLIYLLIIVGVTTLIAFGFNGSGGAVLVAILMHSAFNSSSRFLDPFLGDTPVHAHPSGEMFIALAFLASAALTVLLTRGHLNVEANSSHPTGC
jgi:membrane protease YdiL (CAAX protease family)